MIISRQLVKLSERFEVNSTLSVAATRFLQMHKVSSRLTVVLELIAWSPLTV